MIALPSLIGFAIVFVVLAVACSSTLAASTLLLRGELRRIGPRMERAAATLAIAAPPLLASICTAALAGRSLAAVRAGSGDHCLGHGHHLHLCVVHGAEWAEEVWAVALVVAIGVWMLSVLIHRVVARGQAARELATLAALARPIRAGAHDVLLVRSDRPLCFAAGLVRPRIFASTAAWERWADDERLAAVEHERAHLRRGDLRKRLVLGLLALFGAPLLARRVLELWESASERLADREAARVLGDATPVASALLACAPVLVVPPAASVSFLSSSVVERVDALLESEPDDRRPALGLLAFAMVAVTLLAFGSVVFSDPLHHLLESLIG